MSVTLMTTVNCVKLTDYELGLRLWQSRGTLPSAPSKTMAEGYRKAAVEFHMVKLSEIRCAFRRGIYTPLVKHFGDVEGIVVGDDDSKAINPLTWGARSSRPYLFAWCFGESVR